MNCTKVSRFVHPKTLLLPFELYRNTTWMRTIRKLTTASEDGQAKDNSEANKIRAERNAMRKKMLGGAGVTGARGVNPETPAAQNDDTKIAGTGAIKQYLTT